MQFSTPFLRHDRGDVTARKRRFLFRSFGITGMLIVFSLVFTPLVAHAEVIQKWGQNETIAFDKYFLQNNQWGKQYNGWGDGYQSIQHDTNDDGNGAWSSTFNWWNVLSDDAWHIKSWPSIVQGWQWGTWSNNSGLPIHLWDNKNIVTSWHFRPEGGSWYRADAIYDLWIHSDSDWYNPTDEIMIFPWWTDEETGLRGGTFMGSANIGGENWDLYKGSGGKWTTWYVVRGDKTTQVDNLNIKDILMWLQWGLPEGTRIPNSRYLSSIQAGTEIWYGSGTFYTDSYSVNIY